MLMSDYFIERSAPMIVGVAKVMIFKQPDNGLTQPFEISDASFGYIIAAVFFHLEIIVIEFKI